MTPRRLMLALVFAGTFLFGLAVFAPAALLGYAVEHISGGTLTLAQASGSLWHGSGVLLLQRRTSAQSLGLYRWDFEWMRGALEVRTGNFAPMQVRYSPFARRVGIESLHLALPAAALGQLLPQLGPYQLQGMLDMRSDRLALGPAGADGAVTVDWQQAASGLSSIRPLGDYRIVLKGDGTAVNAQLSTLSGKLVLSASGRFDQAGGMQLNGTAQAAPGASAAELNELLHHIGPETSPGVFALALIPQAGAR